MENMRGSLLMVLAMAFFAGEDGFVKLLSAQMSPGQVLVLLGTVGGAVFWVWLLARGGRLFTAVIWHPMVMLRNAGELIGTIGYVLAVVLTPLSSASAIIQAIPLAVTLGAALFMGETVGWRRWAAILAGLIGVTLVIKPGLQGFDLNSLFAVQAVLGLALRDLATRRMPAWVPSQQISALAFFLVAFAGVGMMAVMGDGWQPVDGRAALYVAGGVALGVIGYTAIVAATRVGEVSVVAPFRYSRLVFGMLVGIIFFGESPDALTYLGAFIIVSAGIYAFWRETRVKRAFQSQEGAL